MNFPTSLGRAASLGHRYRFDDRDRAGRDLVWAFLGPAPGSVMASLMAECSCDWTWRSSAPVIDWSSGNCLLIAGRKAFLANGIVSLLFGTACGRSTVPTERRILGSPHWIRLAWLALCCVPAARHCSLSKPKCIVLMALVVVGRSALVLNG